MVTMEDMKVWTDLYHDCLPDCINEAATRPCINQFVNPDFIPEKGGVELDKSGE